MGIFFCVLLFSGSVICLCIALKNGKEADFAAGIGTLLFVIFLFVLISLPSDREQNPQAIDVYKGKTTLEITYRDSIPVDTVVVWKN